MNIEWRLVRGTNTYWVSNTGLIKRVTGKKEYILRPFVVNKHYCYVCIRIDKNIKRSKLLHRLIAIEFIPNPENKPDVNHINGIKTDNRVENLEWVTRSENMQHAHKLGLKSSSEKQKAAIKNFNKTKRIPVVQLTKEGKLVKIWKEGIRHIQRTTGISNLSACCNGVQKTSGTYKWMFEKDYNEWIEQLKQSKQQ